MPVRYPKEMTMDLLQLKEAEPPARRTLTASPAMKARIEKVAPPPPRPSAQHAVHKPPGKSAIAQKATPAPEMHPPAVVEERPATRDPAGVERRNALFMKLRQLSPALFASTAYVPPPLAIGIHAQIIAALGAEPRDVAVILGIWTGKFRYQKGLKQPGAVRRNLDGSEAGLVSESERQFALQRLEKLKAKRRAQLANAGK
jgi:ProQ/FINO family